jgi:hypothetical protein
LTKVQTWDEAANNLAQAYLEAVRATPER